MSIGRNDPCPCGSGKKYKKCCQPQQDVISLAVVRADNLFRDLWDKLSDYMGRKETANEVEEGFIRFFVVPMDEEEAEETAELAMDWVAFAYPGSGRTFCERFATSAKGLSDQEREVLTDWSKSAPGFFRVESAAGGEFHLSRLPDGKVFQVRAPDTKLATGDLISAWLLPVLSSYRFGYLVQDIAAEVLDPLMHLVKIEMALLQRQRPTATWEELYREHWPRLTDAFTMAVADGDRMLQIDLPSCPPVRWDGQEPSLEDPKSQEVERLIGQGLDMVDDHFEPDDIAGAIRLWKDAALALRPRIVSPEGWAAGVLYLYLTDVLGEDNTQRELADRLGVSVSTVGARSRELAAALAPRWMDPRYVGLMSGFVRMHWRAQCLEAMGYGDDAPHGHWESEVNWNGCCVPWSRAASQGGRPDSFSRQRT